MRNSVYIVGKDTLIYRMFVANNWKIVDDPDDAEFLQFTGGADVSPMLYGEPKHPSTYNNPQRDDQESDLFFRYGDTKKMLGICRGGQFLNVMNGGTMYQDVDNHARYGTHAATVAETGQIVQVTSTHHQMMNPSLVGSTLLVTANLSTYKLNGWGKNTIEDDEGFDTEVVYYDGCLCFQPHPEYVTPDHECQRLYFSLIDQYLKG